MLFPLKALLVSATLACSAAATAQRAMEFRGTIGQQKVTLALEATGDSITSAHYRYESQKSDVPLAEGRFIGSTIILADDDGNVFHLHLKKADGTGTSDLAKTTAMSGTMNRDELELAVEVSLIPK